jgi:UDP-N-acetylmuramate--alanine ligase
MANELSEWKGKRLHFVGIGGAGMSGLARIALSHGISVSGSDAKDSTVLSALGALGAQVHAAHLAQQVDGADFVIYSTAISQSNVELVRARELKLPILTRAQALASLTRAVSRSPELTERQLRHRCSPSLFKHADSIRHLPLVAP